MTRSTRHLELSVVYRRQTRMAVLVDGGNKVPVWLPKSLIEYGGDFEALAPETPIGIVCPEWLAKAKGLI